MEFKLRVEDLSNGINEILYGEVMQEKRYRRQTKIGN